MLDEVMDRFLKLIKSGSLRGALQNVLTFLSALIAAETVAYKYIQWEYGISPSLWMFLRSYISVRILIAFAAIAILLVALRYQPENRERTNAGWFKRWLKTHKRTALYRIFVVAVVMVFVAAGYGYYAPIRVNDILVKFMEPPREFDQDAFAYVVYELNRIQRQWHFEVDFEPFNSATLTSAEQKRCESDERRLICYAEMIAKSGPVIGITQQSLAPAHFAQHRGLTSVVTISDSAYYAPLSTYAYLAYSIVVQSILIHLDLSGRLPENAFRPDEASHGGVFQFAPRKSAIKSVILAASLSPQEEELLFNQFGADYVRSCKELLSMQWYYSERLQRNLKEIFKVSP